MAYLYYLPFAMVFVSGDRLHRRTAPLFLRPDQSYIDAHELKAALRELDQHYDRLPEEIKQLGVLQFASYPPPDIDNAVTRLWDKHMRLDWRELARTKKPRSVRSETSQQIATLSSRCVAGSSKQGQLLTRDAT